MSLGEFEPLVKLFEERFLPTGRIATCDSAKPDNRAGKGTDGARSHAVGAQPRNGQPKGEVDGQILNCVLWLVI